MFLCLPAWKTWERLAKGKLSLNRRPAWQEPLIQLITHSFTEQMNDPDVEERSNAAHRDVAFTAGN